MSASQIRIATIGTWGHIGQALGELGALPNVRFVAHARSMPDEDPLVIHRLTHDESVPWEQDYRRMLREVRPDVVIVSTRIDRINPIAVEAAEAGCHLICEKPLAIEHSALSRLYETCIAKKVQCISMLGNGRKPVMLAAAGAIQNGDIGDVVLLNARKSYKWGERPDWFGRSETYGTTISWIAIHALEMIHILSGQNFTAVAAMHSNRVHVERKACQDNGALLLSLSGGGHASVSFDYLRPDAAATHGDDWIRVVGSRGVIEANLDRGCCRLVSETRPEHELALPAPESYYASFVNGLSQGPPPAEMRRAFMLSHVCLCAADAADQRSVAAIPAMPWGS